MNSEIRQRFFRQFNSRYLGTNLNFGIMSKSEIENYCIRDEIQHQIKQKQICECKHKFSTPKYDYSMYGDHVTIVCDLCNHQCVLKV